MAKATTDAGVKIKLGMVGHFSLAVRDPERSAKFWQESFNLAEAFRFEDGIGLSNEAVTIVLSKGEPDPTVNRAHVLPSRR